MQAKTISVPRIGKDKLLELIKELKIQRNAVVLVHNYQSEEMFEIADYVGDSLELSRKAEGTDADVIVFCGVRFMAETAKILNPGKTVLLPSLNAGCSLADMATVEQLKAVKEQHPDAAVVSYVNTNADIKAMSDICCTSANAVKIVNSLPQEKVIFLPDKNLGRYVQQHTNKKIILWNGYCFVHDRLDARMLLELKEKYPDSEIIAHPEAREEILNVSDHVCGTGGMAKYAEKSSARDFIIVTECGMADRLRLDVPGKNFRGFCNLCHYMKSNDLMLAANSLIKNQHAIEIPDEIMAKARLALERMIAV